MRFDQKTAFWWKLNSIMGLHITVVVGLLAWTVIIASMYYWAVQAEKDHHKKLIEQKAEALGNQTQILRQWIGGHGGVYVEKGGGIEPNPQLSHIPERDIETPSGRQLTLLNSPTVLREILTEFESNSSDQIRLVSPNPINPRGELDLWEKTTFLKLQNGAKKIEEQTVKDGANVFRLMYPIKQQQKCKKCHDYGLEAEGDVVGGLSILVDRSQTDEVFYTLLRRMSFAYIGIWLAGVIGLLLFDVGARKLLLKIEFTSTHDALTKLKNRGAIEEMHRYCVQVAHRYKQDYSVLLIDVDHFKKVNDTYGHSAGDTALKVMAKTLQKTIRATDVAGRFGGEEFLVLAPNSDINATRALAERILQSIRDEDIPHSEMEAFHITVSIGVASNSHQANDAESILNVADKALYRAKDEGRNRVCTP